MKDIERFGICARCCNFRAEEGHAISRDVWQMDTYECMKKPDYIWEFPKTKCECYMPGMPMVEYYADFYIGE